MTTVAWCSGRAWWTVGPIAGLAVGFVDSVVNHVPVLLGEVGTARAERGSWSQAAEFCSLILDAGWAWAAAAVLAGWLVSRHARPSFGLLRGATAGALALIFATAVYYGTDLLFDGGAWWNMATRYWLVGSALLGPPLGLAGALIQRPGRTGVVAALVVPAGAALQMALMPPPPDSRMALPVRCIVWIVAAVTTVVVVHRGRGRSAAPSPAEPLGL